MELATMGKVNEVLFMNGGEGEISYAQNSSFTEKVASMAMPALENAVETLFSKDFHLLPALNAADLGCAAGPNTFAVISMIKRMMEKKCRELYCQTPELQVYLNDLFGNDFNTLFKGLSSEVVGNKCEEVSCYVMGVPGSFHGRLFPRNSLHLVHSSYSVHWLTQAPKGLTSREGLALNKGKIYISKTSPPAVKEAYLSQFHEDFTMFLNARSQEVVPNGCMVLILHGRQSSDPSEMESCFTWELLAIAIAELVSQGLIDEDKLDTFNVPSYFPSLEEVKDIVERDGSFTIDHLEGFELDSLEMQENDKWVRGDKFAKMVRAFTEPIISNQFGHEIMDKLYDKFTHIVVSDLEAELPKTTSIILVLSKIVG
uniref:3,7-dimethylxanthine N-methyltransferase CkTbS n=2 Tax=Camellia sinensis var. assamica TaxID=261999 RepID=CKTBS_CAMSB|nr:RecName: Full=3,7-dimethylxanthine N-methyltransferase CkTbS; AltName: Full=Theobromine synthase; Short=CkTbS [Camellia sinensis var. assamica]QIC50343.1 theobromine synthase [Camellia sinensis var. assamica]